MEHWSNKYLRIPFKDKGRSENGSDCWGLVRIIYQKELNVELPSYLEYNNTLDVRKIPSLLKVNSESDWSRVELGDEQPYDVVVLNLRNNPMHVGVVVEKGFMVHCEKGRETYHTEYTKHADWKNRIYGIFRHKKRSDGSCAV